MDNRRIELLFDSYIKEKKIWIYKMKKCIPCQEVKNESEFYKDRGKKDGLNSRCKECINQKARERNARPEVKEKKKEYSAEYYARPEVKERIKEYDAKPENKERKKEYDAEYNARPEIKERNNQRQKEYDAEYRARPEIKERNNQRQKIYDAKPENKEIRNQREKERYQTDSCYKLRSCISRSVRNGLKKNCGSKHGSSILSKLPYTIQELRQHIESLFEPWMNWQNHGKYNPNRRTWQIDHIKPHSSFHYTDMDCQEFKDCWSLSNLRPLETIANIRKGNKIN